MRCIELTREQEFWSRLEYRICGEFAGMDNGHTKAIWCDGLLPEQYHLDEEPPRIIGTAFMCKSPREWHERWEFTLFLDRKYASRDQIDWMALLPADDVTKWLAYNRAERKIQFEPAAAEKDPQ